MGTVSESNIKTKKTKQNKIKTNKNENKIKQNDAI